MGTSMPRVHDSKTACDALEGMLSMLLSQHAGCAFLYAGGSCSGWPSNYANCQSCDRSLPMCTCRPGYCNPVPSASWAAGGAPMCIAMSVPCPVGNARCPPQQTLAYVNGNLFCTPCPVGCASCSSAGSCDVCQAGYNMQDTICRKFE
jgi:hypothetical protein